jgi:Domain of Unknown Function (DUF1080)
MRYALLLSAMALWHPLAAADLKSGGVIRLFNGKNLEGFDTYLEKQGENKDPDKVFQVHDGMVHISGAEYGYIITKQEYSNYHLRAEFKWGEATHPPRLGGARDSGILFHVIGPNQIWPASVEFQMIEGGTGDIILVGKTTTATRDGITKTRSRFDRRGKSPLPDRSLYVAGYRDPKMEYENPHGQWNVLELIADGDNFKYIVNGKVANEATGCNQTRGKILFQSEGAEVFFRNMELRPLHK